MIDLEIEKDKFGWKRLTGGQPNGLLVNSHNVCKKVDKLILNGLFASCLQIARKLRRDTE